MIVNSERMPPRCSQRVRERHAPGFHRHLVRDEAVEPGLGARALDDVLGEGREVDDADSLAQPPALVADVLEPVRAAEAPFVPRFHARGRKPVGALPAVALAEHGAHALQLVVHRARLRRARVGPLLVRVMDGEDVAVGLLVLRHHETLARVRPEAARVEREHVDARLALDDPLGELPARAARRRDAEAVALVEPHVRQAPGRTDERAAVRRVRDRPVDDVLDAAVRERGHAPLRALDVRHEPIEVAVEEALAEPGRHAVGESRRRARFIRTEDPAHALLAEVIRLVGLAQHGELAPAALAVGFELGRFLVNDVLVLDGNSGHVQPK